MEPLLDYQMRYRGVTMGDRTMYELDDIAGLWDMIVKDRDRDNPRSQGTIPGIHSATFRLIRVNLEVVGEPGSSVLEKAVQNLMSAMSPDQHMQPDEIDDRLYFKFPGEVEKFIYCRPVRRSRPRRNDTEFGLVPVRFELKTYDPRTYSANEYESGEKPSDGNTFTIINQGDALAYPRINFGVDTLGGLTLHNDTLGTQFSVAGLGASTNDYWADMGRFVRGRGDLLIVYKDTTNHYNKWQIPRDAFYLAPGTNDLRLTIASNAEVNLFWRDTWM